jgi:hypothetical protein
MCSVVTQSCPSPAKPSNRLASLSGERCTRGRRLQPCAAMKRRFRFKDLTGQTFGRLKVVGLHESRAGAKRWRCQCECGKTSFPFGNNLVRGKTKSCGCRVNAGTHGMSHSSEFTSWQEMLARCSNPRRRSWKDYGARGIVVCDRWKFSFANFFADMGRKPSEKFSIERKNNNGNYEPNNCIWAAPIVQANNTRFNRILNFNGERMTVAQWARKVGIKVNTIYTRLFRGWSVEKSLTTKIFIRP